jgi:hypothetical protein
LTIAVELFRSALTKEAPEKSVLPKLDSRQKEENYV